MRSVWRFPGNVPLERILTRVLFVCSPADYVVTLERFEVHLPLEEGHLLKACFSGKGPTFWTNFQSTWFRRAFFNGAYHRFASYVRPIDPVSYIPRPFIQGNLTRQVYSASERRKSISPQLFWRAYQCQAGLQVVVLPLVSMVIYIDRPLVQQPQSCRFEPLPCVQNGYERRLPPLGTLSLRSISPDDSRSSLDGLTLQRVVRPSLKSPANRSRNGDLSLSKLAVYTALERCCC